MHASYLVNKVNSRRTATLNENADRPIFLVHFVSITYTSAKSNLKRMWSALIGVCLHVLKKGCVTLNVIAANLSIPCYQLIRMNNTRVLYAWRLCFIYCMFCVFFAIVTYTIWHCFTKEVHWKSGSLQSGRASVCLCIPLVVRLFVGASAYSCVLLFVRPCDHCGGGGGRRWWFGHQTFNAF